MAKVINNYQIKKCVKATILIPYHLRKLVDNKNDVSLNIESLCPTINDVIEVLYEKYPSFTKSIVTEDGKLFGFLSLYLNGKNIKYLDEFDTKLKDLEAKIAIRASLAGG